MRINKYLSQSGLASRRKSELYIQEKRVTINGSIVEDLSYKVKDTDIVKVDEIVINPVKKFKYYVLNKPKNYICSSKDELNRKKVIDLFSSDIRLFSIGRLDYKTTGVILFTNNGDISNCLLRPQNKIKKKYYAETNSPLSIENLKKIKKGIKINNQFLKANVLFIKKNDKNYIWDITLIEGKYREIHRIFNYFNVKVSTLHRFEFAGIGIGKLKPGRYRRLNKNEIQSLQKLIKK